MFDQTHVPRSRRLDFASSSEGTPELTQPRQPDEYLAAFVLAYGTSEGWQQL